MCGVSRPARECRDGSAEGSAAAHVARVAATVCPSRRALRFRRGACRYASLADLYCAFGMTLLRGCYHQILGPRRHLPKLSNGLCRHAGAYVCLNVHLGWQAAESYVERSNAFALIPGHTLLPDCSAAGQPTIEDTSFARHASERGHGTLEETITLRLLSCLLPNVIGLQGPLLDPPAAMSPGVAVRATSWRQVMHRRPVDNVDSRVRSQTYGLKKNCTAFSAVRGSLVPEFQIQTGAPARGSSCCSATRVHRPAAPSCWISSGCGGYPS